MEEPPPPPPPEASSEVLKQLGWQVFLMRCTGKKYYVSERRREARVQPPYFGILGLDEAAFRSLTREEIRRTYYRRVEERGLTDALPGLDGSVDADLLKEAFKVLVDAEKRAEYECRNLLPHAKCQLQGLLAQHEIRQREEAERAARVAAEEAAKAAAEAAEA